MKKLKMIKVIVEIPEYVSSPYTTILGHELDESEMRRQAKKIRRAISHIESDYSFDIVIEEVEEDDD